VSDKPCFTHSTHAFMDFIFDSIAFICSSRAFSVHHFKAIKLFVILLAVLYHVIASAESRFTKSSHAKTLSQIFFDISVILQGDFVDNITCFIQLVYQTVLFVESTDHELTIEVL